MGQKIVGYIRISKDKQDLDKQSHLLLEYARKERLIIDEFIEAEVLSREDTGARRIDELQTKLQKGDTLLVAELSRLGREMLQVLNIINDLSQKGVKPPLFANRNYLQRDRMANYCWRFTAILQKQSGSLSRCE